MLLPIRSALLVLAALSASSVAPAQVGPASEPIAMASVTLPKIATPDLLSGDTTLVAPAEAPVADNTDLVEAPVAAKPGGDLAAMVAQMRSATPGSRELECLAVGIYFESKSEPLAGQLAVGHVIANRAASRRFPPSYCGVLLQRSQFSFIRGREIPSVPRASRQWQTAVAIAKIVDQGLKNSVAEGALFFHAKRVSPGWHLKRVASIGNHIFYR